VGTNGIQAMDRVGRKLMDGGEAAFRLLQEIEDTAEQARASQPRLAGKVWNAAETLREATEWMLAQEPSDRNAGAVAYLRAFARVLGGHYHLKAALADPEGAHGRLAAVFIDRILPEHAALIEKARVGSQGLYALSIEDLDAA
jgi:hypothetical protein